MASRPSSISLTTILSRCLTIAFVLLVSGIASVSSVRLRKLCKDSNIQVMANKGVKIEPYERSRVELSLAGNIPGRKKNKFVLGFDFKTTSANGTLFYGRSLNKPKEVIALVLRDGRLRYIIQCPSLHADILLSTEEGRRVNDNKWHSIHYTTRYGRHGQKGHIQVDGHASPKLYEVDCDKIDKVVMGGHSPTDNHSRYYPEIALQSRYEGGKRYFSWLEQHRWLTDVHGHFEGCIRRLNLSKFLYEPPRYYAVSECD